LIRGLAAAIALLFACVAIGDEASETTRSADFVGVWEFDSDRSDSRKPMLKLLELPWYARAAMSRFTPRMTIRAEGPGLHVLTTSPLGADREQQLLGDGSEQRGQDPLGRKFRQTTRWRDDGSLQLQRSVSLESGRTAHVEGTWQRKGEDLEIMTLVRADDGEPVKIRRVFRAVLEEES
jgi:hypothetical protein